jgi:3-oxoadipate enol-lactonase
MNNLNTGEVTAPDGVRISYHVEGPEGAPWIVLSNSLATDRRVWDPQISALTACRRVLRYDGRGHGASDPGTAPYTFEQLAGDVIALMDHLDIETADFMGISLGGMTGLKLALSHPGRIGRLVCCDARAVAPEAYKAMWDGNIAVLQQGGIAALVEPTLGRWFTADFVADPANAAQLTTVRAMINATAGVGYEGVARCLQTLDMLKDLPTISCPVLYVTGEFDPAAPVDAMQAMAEATPGAEFTMIEGAAHLSNLEQPARFSAAIKGFLIL